MTDRYTRFQILSIDGGGLKGIFPATILAKWEEATGRSAASSFDLIAGTSTGGIIALALGLGIPAKEIVDLYKRHAGEIFPGSHEGENLLSRKTKRFWAELMGWAMGQRYSSRGIQRIMKDRVGGRFLGESSTRLLIPSYNPDGEKNIYIYKTAHHPRLENDYKVSAEEVALATSAAPTYLAPFKHRDGFELLDGGLWANNPVALAVVEALGYLNQTPESVRVLRIGTTEEVKRSSRTRFPKPKIFMAKPALNFMTAGQCQAAMGMAYHLLSKNQIIQINPRVAKGEFAMDRYSNALVGLAHTEWRHASSDLRDQGFLEHQAAPFNPCYHVNSKPSKL